MREQAFGKLSSREAGEPGVTGHRPGQGGWVPAPAPCLALGKAEGRPGELRAISAAAASLGQPALPGAQRLIRQNNKSRRKSRAVWLSNAAALVGTADDSYTDPQRM